jgi:hypothetical protein
MTCAVPSCHELSVTTCVCSAHWLEADEAAHGAQRIEAELLAIRTEQAAADERRARELDAARARRPLNADDRAGERILDRIVDKFWNDAAQAGRNNALAGAAWAAGRLVAGGELEREATVRRLVTDGVAAGLPMREALDVVRGQISRAKAKPRVLERKSEFQPQWAVKW